MADITTIETIILEMIDEDLTTPDNWDGTSEVREWVADGLDELCSFGKFYRRTLTIGLEASTYIYDFSPTRELVIEVKSMWLRNQQRPLVQTSIESLARKNPYWLQTTGAPWEYFILDFEQFGVHPVYSTSEDSVEIDAIMIPELYVGSTGIVGTHMAYEESLIHYAKHMLYLRLGRIQDSVKEYQLFLTAAGASKEFLRQLTTARERRQRGISEG